MSRMSALYSLSKIGFVFQGFNLLSRTSAWNVEFQCFMPALSLPSATGARKKHWQRWD